jgi:hypothetical protein
MNFRDVSIEMWKSRHHFLVYFCWNVLLFPLSDTKMIMVYLWTDAGNFRPFPNLRGVNILEIDPFNCTLKKSSRFDTGFSPNDSAKMASYLSNVAAGTVLVGVTSDNSTVYLSSAWGALTALGVSVGDVEPGGSFAFVVQVGYSDRTVMNKSLSHNDTASALYVSMLGETGCNVDHLPCSLFLGAIEKRMRSLHIRGFDNCP